MNKIFTPSLTYADMANGEQDCDEQLIIISLLRKSKFLVITTQINKFQCLKLYDDKIKH